MSTFRVNSNLMAMNALRNLGTTNNQFSASVTKLSTGLRINSGADDPAGLQISEGFRSQIGGLSAALRNNQDAINFAKTAEGALNEVSQLLRDARALAIANGNDATLSASQKQANQNQLQSILNSIDRIASTTQFGQKKLLDGSAGVQAAVVNKARLESASVGGTWAAATGHISVTANDTVTANVTVAATKATVTGNQAVVAGNAMGVDGKLTINGITFQTTASMTAQQLVDAINAKSSDTGVQVDITGGFLVFTSTNFGTGSNSIQITNDTAGLGFTAAGTRTLGSGTAGANAQATFTLAGVAGSVTSTLTADALDGKTFRDSAGNVFKLTDAGATTVATTANIAAITAGAASFQVGANAGQRVVMSLANSNSTALGMVNVDITSASGADSALTLIDNAINTISSKRGDMGNFMRNILESNVRTLGIAKENITATESSIRDTDVAEEMTMYTKLQILQQSGLAVLAQANQAPQAVLSLLRG